MTVFEKKLVTLLEDCERHLVPVQLKEEKWVITDESRMQIREFVDKKSSIAHSYHFANPAVTEYESFREAKEAFENDKVFSKAGTTAGYFGQFPRLLEYILVNSGKQKRSHIEFDTSNAKQIAASFRKDLTRSALQYSASARLLGVRLTQKEINLPDRVTAHSLSRAQLNRRQIPVEPYVTMPFTSQFDAVHPTELRLSIKVPVDLHSAHAHFNAQNFAVNTARDAFEKIVDAIIIAGDGSAKLGPVDITGGIFLMQRGRSFSHEVTPNINITIRKRDVANIAVIFKLITHGRGGDKTLVRSIQRFLLGRKRITFVDKLVDYVIAWEALLLTNEGNPSTQELGYRFALNGASLITCAVPKSSPRDIFLKMKCGYQARSNIVHGGSDSNLNKTLANSNFTDTKDLCDFLEANYRKVIFWLLTVTPNHRPYKGKSGWEQLIWR